MKAAQYQKYGGPEVIVINDNVAKPTPLKGQLLVEVFAASLNPIDWKVRAGYLKEKAPLKFPITIGGNFSGVIVLLGDGVTKFKIGDEVYGQAIVLNGGSGSLAEFLVSNEDNSAIKPKNASHIEAASLPLVGASAIQALEEHINLQKGQKILIHGGAGGIGSIAIQLAKSKGAYVATTVRGDDIEFVKKLGADEVVDYKKEKFEEKLSGYDGVYDTVGGDTTDRSFKVLKKGGVLVSMLGEPNQDLAKEYGVKVVGQSTQTNSKNLSRLAQLVDSGVIKPQVDKVFPLDQTRQAFEYMETGHPKGKVVISIKE
ncbi:NADP-dependent oxidoreductase [Candidatus Daviesbacteria bacterium]|nr:NADP-dependent oxidoreductase [Candidatus Daviesbacteria bacterium]